MISEMERSARLRSWLLPKAPNTGWTGAASNDHVTITERRGPVNPAVRRTRRSKKKEASNEAERKLVSLRQR